MPLTVQAPEGAHFEFDEVKTAKGTQSLGDVPILVWDNAQKMIEFYGEQGVLDMADGTSIRVSAQSIARRLKVTGKTDDEIATKQLEFKPGKRQVGAATPTTRAASSAKKASEKVSGDTLSKFLEKIASGELSEADLEALAG
jgi:hypothetical protein